MEWNDRMAAARKAAGLTQEQMGELVGVSRQAVSKWESGQAVPDAVTVARLCEALQVSADYILLGKEPEAGAAAPAYTPPDACPCCGRPVSGTICPVCGYPLPSAPPRGPQYAIVMTPFGYTTEDGQCDMLVKYCGLEREYARALLQQGVSFSAPALLRRGLDDQAAQWIAAHLDRNRFYLTIVEDCGEENDDALLTKPMAMELPERPPAKGPGFGETVAAVILGIFAAVLILSFF
jgi:DNA-binding XRE family transcriptional regulator